MIKKMILTFCAATALVTISYAKPGGGKDRQPPKEAIEACKGLEVGTQCTAETPRGTLTGECVNTPDKKYIVCKPEDGKKGRPDKE